MDARLIVDPPAGGAWNMAVDEALFHSAQRARTTTLRFYQWSVPTLSLGYFQSVADRVEHSASVSCPVVRRATGGGAIVHDQELTYSLLVPIREDRSAASQKLVQLVHQACIDVLKGLGIEVFRYGDLNSLRRASSEAPRESGLPEPFLCFQRRTAEDLLVGDHKIVGSAQRRLHGTLLQHGSVLLGRSSNAPELPGLAEILGKEVPICRFSEMWAVLLGKMLGYRFQAASRNSAEEDLAHRFEGTKFATREWTMKR